MAKRVITFGEVLMRNAAPRHERFTQARQWEVIYGGTESNVAVALAHFGVDAAFVTAFPPNELGQAAANYVRQYGVDTSEIIWRGDRLGLYFLETGGSVRPSKVIYDRQGSSFSELRPGDIDWRAVFDGADWFHFTGISAAVSESAAAVCGEASGAAQSRGIDRELRPQLQVGPVEPVRGAQGDAAAYGQCGRSTGWTRGRRSVPGRQDTEHSGRGRTGPRGLRGRRSWR